MMSGLPSGLQQRLQPTYIFLVVYSATGHAIVGAPALAANVGKSRGFQQEGLVGEVFAQSGAREEGYGE